MRVARAVLMLPGLALLGILLGAAYLILTPIATNPYEVAPGIQCLSNLKGMSAGFLMYASDHDDRLPLAPLWMDATQPYIKGIHLTRCPGVVEEAHHAEHGYAFNLDLSGRKQTTIRRPDRTVALYDSTRLGRNASDRVASLPRPGRHHRPREPRYNNVAYADGHAKSIKDTP